MKRLLSYIFPFRVKQYTSKISGNLDVSYINGKKILDTDNSNYSFGSLQRILHKGLVEINFDDSIKSILVLGLGGGSILETLRDDFKSEAFIELVEIDAEIISIAKKEFDIDRFKNINIVHADAFDYVNTTNQKFDLIIVDIFIGNKIPEIFSESSFTSKLAKLLDANGKIIYNTMHKTITREAFASIKNTFIENKLDVSVLEGVEITNDLILAVKK